VELDYEFHAAICRASGHRTLFETWSAMSGKIRLYLSTTNLMYRDLNAIVRGHLDIVAALRAHSPKRAAQALQDHLGERLDARAALIAGRTCGDNGRIRSANPGGRAAWRWSASAPEGPRGVAQRDGSPVDNRRLEKTPAHTQGGRQWADTRDGWESSR
jgi:hypothetical protein